MGETEGPTNSIAPTTDRVSEPGEDAGFLQTYLAYCNYFNVEPLQHVLDYVSSAVQSNCRGPFLTCTIAFALSALRRWNVILVGCRSYKEDDNRSHNNVANASPRF